MESRHDLDWKFCPLRLRRISARVHLDLDGRRLSFLDFGGLGQPLLALHGHFSEGQTFAHLARELAPDWRVIAPDQRGHGESDRPADYSRQGYIADAVAVLDHLGLGTAVVLGHSLGGVNAYQLAARYPERVLALVIEGERPDPSRCCTPGQHASRGPGCGDALTVLGGLQPGDFPGLGAGRSQ